MDIISGQQPQNAFIIILFALRQLQVIPQIFYSTSQFTIDIYIYTLRRLLAVLYHSNVSSNVMMCLTTSCFLLGLIPFGAREEGSPRTQGQKTDVCVLCVCLCV